MSPATPLQRFIRPLEFALSPRPPGLHWASAHFDVDAFDERLLEDSGLTFPPGIASSASKRRAEYFAGRYLAMALQREAGFAAQNIGRDEDGCPLWPEPLIGSISHSGGYAIAAIARRDDMLALGIDAQYWLDEDRAQRLQERICSPEERAVFVEAGLSVAEGISLCFSAKESIYKAFFPAVRRYFGYHSARLLAVDTQACTLRCRVQREFCPSQLRDSDITLRYLKDKQRVVSLLAIANPSAAG